MNFESKEALRDFVKNSLEEYLKNPVSETDKVDGADLRFNPLYHLSIIRNEIGVENHADYLDILREWLGDDFWKEHIAMFLSLY